MKQVFKTYPVLMCIRIDLSWLSWFASTSNKVDKKEMFLINVVLLTLFIFNKSTSDHFRLILDAEI
jgi:hypothetical protein